MEQQHSINPFFNPFAPQLSSQPVSNISSQPGNSYTFSFDGYDLSLMSENTLKENVIEFRCTDQGFEYRVVGLSSGKEEKATIPWSELPENFPRQQGAILQDKLKYLPEILALTSKKGHTPFDGTTLDTEGQCYLQLLVEQYVVVNKENFKKFTKTKSNKHPSSEEISKQRKRKVKCENQEITLSFPKNSIVVYQVNDKEYAVHVFGEFLARGGFKVAKWLLTDQHHYVYDSSQTTLTRQTYTPQTLVLVTDYTQKTLAEKEMFTKLANREIKLAHMASGGQFPVGPFFVGEQNTYNSYAKYKSYLFDIYGGKELFEKFKKFNNLREFSPTLKMLNNMAFGFKKIHENGVLHLDGKLENVLINEKDTIKIIDFGLGTVKNTIHAAAWMNAGTAQYKPSMKKFQRRREANEIFAFIGMCFELLFAESLQYRNNCCDVNKFISDILTENINDRQASQNIKHLKFLLQAFLLCGIRVFDDSEQIFDWDLIIAFFAGVQKISNQSNSALTDVVTDLTALVGEWNEYGDQKNSHAEAILLQQAIVAVVSGKWSPGLSEAVGELWLTKNLASLKTLPQENTKLKREEEKQKLRTLLTQLQEIAKLQLAVLTKDSLIHTQIHNEILELADILNGITSFSQQINSKNAYQIKSFYKNMSAYQQALQERVEKYEVFVKNVRLIDDKINEVDALIFSLQSLKFCLDTRIDEAIKDLREKKHEILSFKNEVMDYPDDYARQKIDFSSIDIYLNSMKDLSAQLNEGQILQDAYEVERQIAAEIIKNHDEIQKLFENCKSVGWVGGMLHTMSTIEEKAKKVGDNYSSTFATNYFDEGERSKREAKWKEDLQTVIANKNKIQFFVEYRQKVLFQREKINNLSKTFKSLGILLEDVESCLKRAQQLEEMLNSISNWTENHVRHELTFIEIQFQQLQQSYFQQKKAAAAEEKRTLMRSQVGLGEGATVCSPFPGQQQLVEQKNPSNNFMPQPTNNIPNYLDAKHNSPGVNYVSYPDFSLNPENATNPVNNNFSDNYLLRPEPGFTTTPVNNAFPPNVPSQVQATQVNPSLNLLTANYVDINLNLKTQQFQAGTPGNNDGYPARTEEHHYINTNNFSLRPEENFQQIQQQKQTLQKRLEPLYNKYTQKINEVTQLMQQLQHLPQPSLLQQKASALSGYINYMQSQQKVYDRCYNSIFTMENLQTVAQEITQMEQQHQQDLNVLDNYLNQLRLQFQQAFNQQQSTQATSYANMSAVQASSAGMNNHYAPMPPFSYSPGFSTQSVPTQGFSSVYPHSSSQSSGQPPAFPPQNNMMGYGATLSGANSPLPFSGGSHYASTSSQSFFAPAVSSGFGVSRSPVLSPTTTTMTASSISSSVVNEQRIDPQNVAEIAKLLSFDNADVVKQASHLIYLIPKNSDFENILSRTGITIKKRVDFHNKQSFLGKTKTGFGITPRDAVKLYGLLACDKISHSVNEKNIIINALNNGECVTQAINHYLTQNRKNTVDSRVKDVLNKIAEAEALYVPNCPKPAWSQGMMQSLIGTVSKLKI